MAYPFFYQYVLGVDELRLYRDTHNTLNSVACRMNAHGHAA